MRVIITILLCLTAYSATAETAIDRVCLTYSNFNLQLAKQLDDANTKILELQKQIEALRSKKEEQK